MDVNHKIALTISEVMEFYTEETIYKDPELVLVFTGCGISNELYTRNLKFKVCDLSINLILKFINKELYNKWTGIFEVMLLEDFLEEEEEED